ncbi:MAG: DNA-directed RNA polymerase subunit delta [Mycoplasmoidaceae bacterium]
MKKDLIDIAYEVAKKKFKKGKFTFRELLAEVIKTHSECKDLGGDLYVEMISDIRFLSLGNDEWALQEYFNYEEYEKISSAMFGLEKELNEPELLDDDLPVKTVSIPLEDYEIIDKDDEILDDFVDEIEKEIEIEVEEEDDDEDEEIEVIDEEELMKIEEEE